MNKQRSRLFSWLIGSSAANGGNACGDSTLRVVPSCRDLKGIENA
ncbi:MAG: hypothetical protein WA173_07190 [Pseudomonas sp.]